MRKFLLSVVMCLLLVLVSSVTVQANGSVFYDDTQHTGYAGSEIAESNYYMNGIVHQREIGTIYTGPNTSTIAVNTITGRPGADSKVVTWAVQNSSRSGFQLAQLSTIARDYEAKHPGWKVMGIINGDQYTLGRGTDLHATGRDPYIYQTYYPFIADYEKWFSVTATKGGGNFVGILNDGRQDPLLMQSANLSNIAGLFLSIINENKEVIAKFPVEKLNVTPNQGETAIFSPYYTDISGSEAVIPPIQVSGENLFYVEQAEIAYVSNSIEYATLFAGTNKANYAVDAFFGRGTISSITETTSVSRGQFLIQTNNATVLEALDVGVRVIGQFEYIGDINQVESGIGFHTVQRDNNQDRSVSGTYNTNNRPRSIIGRKNDGSIVLMVIDDYLDSYGTTGYGINAILKRNGIVEAYQMDGGGSAQMWIRDNDSFRPVTYSADDPTNTNLAHQRSVLNAVLFVVRTIDVTHEKISASPNTLDISVNLANSYGKDVSKMYVRIGARQSEVIDGVARFTGLRANTDYNYTIFVEDSFGKIEQTIFTGNASTSKRLPVIQGYTYEEIDGKIQIALQIQDIDGALMSMSMNVKGALYAPLGNVFTVTLVNGQPFVRYFYNIEDGKGMQIGLYYLPGYINQLHLASEMVNNQTNTIKKIYE